MISAILSLPERKIHPVVFVNSNCSEEHVLGFEGADLIRSSFFEPQTLPNFLFRLSGKATGGRNPALAAILRRNRIHVLSHFNPVKLRNVRTIGWIQDFQQLTYPQFFSASELSLRERAYARWVRDSDVVLVSSNSALSDARKMFEKRTAHFRVLSFVPQIDIEASPLPLTDLQQLYGITAPYFHVPGQFWIHKNHGLVLDALNRLRDQRVHALVVSTGTQNDYRHPAYARDLLKGVRDRGLQEYFLALGVVPHRHVQSLIRHSIAVLNPSLFEGWSTTVEEAAAFGKPVLLSDIPVHREQAPPFAQYFRVDDAQGLADSMASMIIARAVPASPSIDLIGSYKRRRLAFAATYQAIVTELASGHR